MRSLLVLCYVAVVSAGSLNGYNYQQAAAPAPQYEAPQYQQLPQPQYLPPVAPQPQYQSAPQPQYQPAPQPQYQPAPQPQYQPQYQPAPAPAAPIVSKHFHTFAAPEESADELQSQVISGGPARKHYRVVFIKSPSQSTSAAALQIAQAQNEEKTVIYVLAKKTDASDIQTAIQQAPSQPSKPEVFFIKYKTPEEAQHAQQTIQAQYDQLGGSSQFSDEGVAAVQSYVGSLGQQTSAEYSGVTSGGATGASNSYLPPNH